MRNYIVAALASIALMGCANTSANQAKYATDLAALQMGLPVLEAALGTYPVGSSPAVVKAETDLNVALAVLAANPLPSSAATVLTLTGALVASLPANVLSPMHQAEAAGVLLLARIIVADMVAAPVVAAP